MARLSGILILIAVLDLPCGVAQERGSAFRIARVSESPKLQELASAAAREAGGWVKDFRQYNPGDGNPASLETTVFLAYDDSNLYVVFVCKDEPGRVRARMAKREAIEGDDSVTVYLDTFFDRQHAYMFSANPLGVQADGMIAEGQEDDLSFDTLWHSQGRLTPDGYVVLMAIPFKSLRFPARAAQTWGLALGRVIPRKNEFSTWPYISSQREGFVHQFATLEGLSAISPGRNLQFIPYGIFTDARFLDTRSGPEFRKEYDGRAGLDAKIVLRDALALDVALNPDFSHVESDEPQVTINQRFEVFFPEKRPFFIENAAYFRTPVNLFFSRRIADPRFGARLTGKVRRWAIAGLAMDDRAEDARGAQADTIRGRSAGVGVLRLRREFGEQSGIGLLATSRDFAGGANRVVSLDSRLKLSPNWVFTGQLAHSSTRQFDGARSSGPAYFAELEHIGRHFIHSGACADYSPRFFTELGFIPRVDIRETSHHASYRWRRESGLLLSFGPSALALANWDRRGRLQDWVHESEFAAEFAGQTELSIKRSESFELFEEAGFRKHSTSLWFRTDWLDWLGLSAQYRLGTNANFFPASGPPFLADSADGQFKVALRPGRRVLLEQFYTYSRLRTRGPRPSGIFTNHILRSKLNLQLTHRLSLRTILDYDALLPNQSLVALERDKRLGADALLTYLVNPGTALHVGYTDKYGNVALSPDDPQTLRHIGSPTTSTGRQFFVKLSYLFRY